MIAIKLPLSITALIDRLEAAGFEAYVVGGCVRDSLLGRPIADYDMTTSASPEQMKTVFSDYHVIETGIRHGTLTVISDGKPVEITTYRVDGKYSDHRKPESVTFTRELRDDLARRDFTVNAMAYNPNAGLVDLYDGIQDLRCRTIRCVGNPDTRFNEDALRILRGIRFAATYGFKIEPRTKQALHDCAPHLAAISAERKSAELTRLLTAPYAKEALYDCFDVIAHIIPAFAAHEGDWYKTLAAVSRAPLDLSVRLALFLAALGTEDAAKTLQTLRFDRETSDTVMTILSHRHDTIGISKAEIRRAMAQFGVPMLRKRIAFHRATTAAYDWDAASALMLEVLASGEAYDRSMLQLSGTDLTQLGIKGKEVGRILSILLDAVIDGNVENEHDALIAYAKTV